MIVCRRYQFTEVGYDLLYGGITEGETSGGKVSWSDVSLDD